MLFAQVAAEQSHDLVWVALIGAVQAVFLAIIVFLQNRQNSKITENTQLTRETHRMVNGALSQQMERTAALAEEKAAVTGAVMDKAVAEEARKQAEAKAADIAAIDAAKANTPHPPP